MSGGGERSVVTVTIAGDEYTLRAYATPEYTRACASFVDRAIEDVFRQAHLVEAHKAAILAALSITNQLFEARAEVEALRQEIARAAAGLAADVEAMAPGDLASSA